MPMGRNSSVYESILFKSELKFAKILNEGLKQPMLILCLYVGGAHFAHCPRIYSRRGNIVSSMFISLRRLAMPQFMDVRHKSHVFFYCIALPASFATAAVSKL